MSAYRVDGGTKIGGAHRPCGTETSESKCTLVYETEAQKLEREIAEALDVSEATVKRWRKRFGYSRTSIKTKGR